MRNLTLCLYALCGVLLFAAFARKPALADETAPVSSVPEHALSIELQEPLPAETLDVEILRALETWNPRVLEETLRPWANAIVEAAPDRRDALWLAAQASVETKFVPYVLDFRCNRSPGDYPMGNCDHGAAIGPWQMHDRKMIEATPAEQAKRAIEWMRARPQAWTTWRAAKAQAEAW